LRRGFKLETLWAPPGVFAVRLPGFGFDLKANPGAHPVLGDLGCDRLLQSILR
jgi:hypothetical protein